MAKSIPVDFKIRGTTEKAVLRDAAKGILPDDIRLRPKRGFMGTSEAVDFFGADRAETAELRRRYLSPDAFERARVFSRRAFQLVNLLARMPRWVTSLRRLRRDANKVIMYALQTHMLHEMFVADPRWLKQPVKAAANQANAATSRELVSRIR